MSDGIDFVGQVALLGIGGAIAAGSGWISGFSATKREQKAEKDRWKHEQEVDKERWDRAQQAEKDRRRAEQSAEDIRRHSAFMDEQRRRELDRSDELRREGIARTEKVYDLLCALYEDVPEAVVAGDSVRLAKVQQLFTIAGLLPKKATREPLLDLCKLLFHWDEFKKIEDFTSPALEALSLGIVLSAGRELVAADLRGDQIPEDHQRVIETRLKQLDEPF